jgi:hypothetical protein
MAVERSARLIDVLLFSFGRDAGRRIDAFASDFVLTPLTDPEGTARVACFHLGPGEGIGEHPAVVGQLFCVVAGDGWVSGDDGVRTPIGTMQAALWAPGERHATGTDVGLVAIVLEGDSFDVAAPLLPDPPGGSC